MGKGDIKTRRGKIFNGSYGARRPRKVTRSAPVNQTGKKSPDKKR